MLYLAIDPGGTTGWASYDALTGTFMSGHLKTVPRGKFSGHGHYQELYDFLELYEPDVLIYENFENRGQANANLLPAEYIGVILLWWRQHEDRVKLHRQGASNVKRFVPDKWLKDIGVWNPEARPHGMDAMRHLVYNLVYDKMMHNLLPSYMGVKSV